ncbi:ribosomal protein S6 kinase delta-1-like [Uloborus diversus]|uniref:ribosomal protein S6 kinase delta-1-like n=1 Tax=Uloborus diversus TaxID=327109 RepID=UPI00240A0E64|nr:ribosomal protein S6 kinase delta-1-like [Uloborus diversus]
MSKKEKDPWVRIFDVSEPILHKKGYTLYKVTSKVFPKNSVEAVSEVTVWKRYNDFKKLHKALSSIHQSLYLKDTFPTFAKARFFGRFEESVIEERRQSALSLLKFAASYPPLFTSQVFVKFFEGGHLVENYKENSEVRVEDNVLLPETTVLQCSILQPKTENNSVENNLKDASNTLGGTWQHRQLPDNISLGSHCTEDEDDRTTFTDDDSCNSRPSLNLSEFDPLFEAVTNDSPSRKFFSDQNNLCNNWLLSALQSCSIISTEVDIEGTLEFPVPFGDLECAEDVVTPSNEFSNATNFSKLEHFTFDTVSCNEEQLPDVSAFDPILNTESSLNDFDDNLYNYDDFAMTPNSCKTELQKRPSFIVHASKYVVNAQEAEENERYAEAFESYKKAIDLLLQGIQKDKCSEMNDAVRKKVLLYLMRAEEIYENRLPKANPKKDQIHSSVIEPIDKVSSLQGCMQDLNKYKVLGVLDKVLLVLDISDNSTYVVKTLYKSSSRKSIDIPHIIPQNVPFMVKLFKIYETSYAIFLILQHATGGRLWDYVSSFLHRSPLSPCNDSPCLYIEPKNKTELSNVYSGKKITENGNKAYANSSMDSDLIPSKNCPSSYVALFKHYAASVNKEENTALAKYHRFAQLTPDSTTNHNSSNICQDSNSESKQNTLILNSNNQIHQNKNARNRLSSSTGSLETGISQKACAFEAFNAMDEAVSQACAKVNLHLPESCVCLWAAEIIVALESLHNLGITWMDFHPDNILLGAEGHILLTYQSQWSCVDHVIKETLKENLFCAPEVGNIFPVSNDSDWWSTGAIIYELLTGKSLLFSHPTGITRHTILNFPSDISSDAKDFITKLLQFNPTERLGSGVYGIEEIKSHPFFRTIDWESFYQQ